MKGTGAKILSLPFSVTFFKIDVSRSSRRNGNREKGEDEKERERRRLISSKISHYCLNEIYLGLPFVFPIE